MSSTCVLFDLTKAKVFLVFFRVKRKFSCDDNKTLEAIFFSSNQHLRMRDATVKN